MESWGSQNFADCQLGDKRSNQRALEIGKTLLGFLTVIAAELLRLIYLHGTPPQAPAETVLALVQLNVLKAKLPKILTVAWAVETVARLGDYLEHRRKTTIGIQVLWRGWLKLASLCQGLLLAGQN